MESMVRGLNTSLATTSITDKNNSCTSTGGVARIGETGHASIIGTPIWQTQDLQELANSKGNAEALTTAYRENGKDLCKAISGPYAFVISDPENACFLAATDSLCRFPLYYYPHENDVIYGSSAAAVLAHPITPAALNKQGIYDYVYFHMVPAPNTIYHGLHKLQAGKLLELTQGKQQISTYWLPRFSEKTEQSMANLGGELKSVLKSSVSRAMANQQKEEQKIGAFLSGGLDSSTVVGMMSELADNQAEAFSIGFSAEGYDEMEYARITAKHFGVKLNEYYVTPEDVVDALPKVATSYDEPFGNSSALPAYFCAKFAKEHGVTCLLAGDGGDELFAGNERYAKQSIFERYQKVPTAIKRHFLEPVVSALNGKTALGSKAHSYVQQANTPLPDRLQSYNFLHRHQPDEIFNSEFLASINTEEPLQMQRDIYSRPTEATELNRMLYLDWQITLADNDLRKVSHMCALAGVDVVYPMLDDELVAFSASIPSHWKLKGQDLRHFYKKSLQGWLPDQTINKPKQGFGLPFGVWMQTHKPLQEMAYDNLTSLKSRPYFNHAFLDNLIKLHKEGHAAYYGELIWILTVFELWLKGKS